MKRFSLVVLCIVVLLMSCSIEEKSSNQVIKIGLLISSLDNPFFDSLKDHIQYESDKSDFELILLDSQNNIEQEKEGVLDLIRSKVDIVLFNPVDAMESSNNLLLLNEENIPVIAIDRKFHNGDVVSEITSDNYQGGYDAGNYLKAIFTTEKQLLILEGIENTTANINRVKGILDALSGSHIKIQNQISANFSRQEAYDQMTVVFQEGPYPDAVFAANDQMALGALDAMLEAKRNIVIIGFDGTDEAIDAVINGYLTATLMQQHDLMAQKCVELCRDYLNGKPIESDILIETKLVSITKKEE